MSAYPQDIVNESGWGRIHQGHTKRVRAARGES